MKKSISGLFLNYLSLVLANIIIIACECKKEKYDNLELVNQNNKIVVRDTLILLDTIKISKSNYISMIEFEKNLKLVQFDMNSNQKYSLIPNIISELEDITNIYFEIGGDIISYYRPRYSDYKKWRDWFEKNKYKLYWDEKEQKVKLRE